MFLLLGVSLTSYVTTEVSPSITKTGLKPRQILGTGDNWLLRTLERESLALDVQIHETPGKPRTLVSLTTAIS